MSVRNLAGLFALLATLTAPPPALAAHSAPVVLKRADKWVVNYAADACQLLGAFGEGDGRLIVQFSRYAPSAGSDLILIGKPIRSVQGLHSILTIDFGPTINPHKVLVLNGTNGTQPMTILGRQRLDDAVADKDSDSIEPAALTPEQEAGVTWLDVTNGNRTYRLDLGKMSAPMKILRQCTDDLVRAWGLDPVVQATLSAQPVPRSPASTWLHTSDYPPGALNARQSGVVHFRLDVDATGAVAGCHIQQATQTPDLQKKTCAAIARRARFSPALDAGGQPVASYYVNAVRWLSDG